MPHFIQRRGYFPKAEILTEVQRALRSHQPGDIDWVTFVGSGKPTLHSGIGWLIQEVKRLTDLPIAVLTNGSLLYLPEVRRDLMAADVVMPTVDAGTPHLYRQINRPHPAATFARLIDGLVAFRQEYSGKLWVELMLVRDLNDTETALQDVAAVLRRIQPDQVHLNLPTRPPAETWVQPSDAEGLLRARAILGDIATVVHPAEGTFDLSGFDTAIEAIISIITRHPMSQAELERTLSRWTPGQVRERLAELAASGQAQRIERYSTPFWSAAPAYYPDKLHSRKPPVSQPGQ
ncbi:MAG: radical SAM protein [Candidatus Promineifilaceae bacterium]